ncbi:MAG: hypothetical protein R2715_10535 [Ilumatobacteraceae bacterium]
MTGYNCVGDPFSGSLTPVTGDFVAGVGGCAFVFLDGEASLYEPQIATWLAAPSDPLPGEPVAFRYVTEPSPSWQVVGSAE